MSFEKFYSKSIPIINWTFFKSEDEASCTFNADEFDGWKKEWKPVATDQLGDIVVFNDKNHVGIINHEERGSPCFNLISKIPSELEILLGNLLDIENISDIKDISNLREIKKKLIELRKIAPRSLKEYFTYEAEQLQEQINDIRFYSTKDGKIIKALEEYSGEVFSVLRVNNRYLGISIEKDFESKTPRLVVSGWLEEGESIDELMEVIKKYNSPYPLDIRKIYSHEEVLQFRASKT